MTILVVESNAAVRKKSLQAHPATEAKMVCNGKFGFKGAANEKFGINCDLAEAQFGTGRGIMGVMSPPDDWIILYDRALVIAQHKAGGEIQCTWSAIWLWLCLLNSSDGRLEQNDDDRMIHNVYYTWWFDALSQKFCKNTRIWRRHLLAVVSIHRMIIRMRMKMRMRMREQLPSTGFPESMLDVDQLAIHCFWSSHFFNLPPLNKRWTL